MSYMVVKDTYPRDVFQRRRRIAGDAAFYEVHGFAERKRESLRTPDLRTIINNWNEKGEEEEKEEKKEENDYEAEEKLRFKGCEGIVFFIQYC